jgi:MoaA/NifB/PqqE/SkfB family radical SAM enzyme
MDSNNSTLFKAINELSKEFQILGDPIDLSLLREKNGEQKIFNMLQKVYRPAFGNNQRILVIQDSNEIYTYEENLASDALIFLQKSLQIIDISNFFVIVISGNKQIEKELEWVRIHHSTDTKSISFHHTPIPFEQQIMKTDSFCSLLWMHLYVDTRLEIAPCCVADQTKPWGSLEKHTMMEIINSKRANTMRLNMIHDQPCSECNNCYVKEKYSKNSRRIKTNKEYQHLRQDFINQTNEDGSLKLFKPLTLDIRLNNTCNLKCRTCDGQSSSQLAYEEKKLFNNLENYNRIPTKISRLDVLDKTIDYVHNANEIYFAGGEPLIMHEHYAMLDRLIDIGKTDTKLGYSTNFTLLTYKDFHVLDYWNRFSNVTLFASIDGHGPVFEYVRHGASWAMIEANLHALKKQCPHVEFYVNSTVSVFSAESVMELQQKWHTLGMLDIQKFKINPVSFNDYYSLSTLFPHHKRYLSKKINEHRAWLASVGNTMLATSWEKLQKTMWEENKGYLSLMIASVNQMRDVERSENFKSLFPQFSDLFDAENNSQQYNLG